MKIYFLLILKFEIKKSWGCGWQCKYYESKGSITIVTTDIGKPLTEEVSAMGVSSSMMEFDCKGFNLVDRVFGSGWKAKYRSRLEVCTLTWIFFHQRKLRISREKRPQPKD